MSSVLGDNHQFEPGSVLGWIRQPEMHFFGGTESSATAHGTTMESLQFSLGSGQARDVGGFFETQINRGRSDEYAIDDPRAVAE
jgi:hypothetical protein